MPGFAAVVRTVHSILPSPGTDQAESSVYQTVWARVSWPSLASLKRQAWRVGRPCRIITIQGARPASNTLRPGGGTGTTQRKASPLGVSLDTRQ